MGDVAPESRPVSSVETDRRAHRRAVMDRPVLLETKSRTTTVRSVDVSGGGMTLRTDSILAIGDQVGVYFELPIGYGVEARAQVLRREGDVVALRFVEAEHEAIVAIRSFCRVSGLLPASRSMTPQRGVAAAGQRR